jgi:LmbE family N-acetylglucosaminyl deacetylase
MSSDAGSAPPWQPWSSPTADVFVPDGVSLPVALSRTTHLGIGAHPDDLEIMAYHGILTCFQLPDRWFTGVTVTDGRGSARAHAYGSHTDEQMAEVRRREQRNAAAVGGYAAMVQLGHVSSAVKDAAGTAVAADLDALLGAMSPEVVYTHNLADKHDTHVAVALRTVAALRRKSTGRPPRQIIGCEVWRDLDWLDDRDKVAMVVDGRDHLGRALLGVYDSQIAGGKRYDLATSGRRVAHATFFESRDTDGARSLVFGIDLTPLVHDPDLDPSAFIGEHIARFAEDVRLRIAKL